MIVIIDYGIGNVGSIYNMIKKIGFKCVISCDLKDIKRAKKIILPGVGSFDAAMEKINSIKGLKNTLTNCVIENKIPLLGVCLGMQLLTLGSEEGKLPGLGWIDANTKKFPKLKKLKVPHMGWNTVKIITNSTLIKKHYSDLRFYFVHSYYVSVNNKKFSAMKTEYGIEFDSAIEKENIFGVQFHPEKSHRYGMKLLKSFCQLKI